MTVQEIHSMEFDAFVDGSDGELFRRLRDEDPCHWNPEPDGGRGLLVAHPLRGHQGGGLGLEDVLLRPGTQIQDRRAEGHGKPSIHNMDAPRHKRCGGCSGLRPRPRGADGAARPRRDQRAPRRAPDGRYLRPRDTATMQIPILVFATMLGAEPADAHRLLEWTNVMSGQTDPDYVPDPDVVERPAARCSSTSTS